MSAMRLTRPGDWLRSLAAQVCSPRTMERLIDPVIADLQCEHAAAVGRGQVWRSRWIRLSGYVAFWKAVALHAEQRCAEGAYGRASADNWALGRTVGFSAAAVVALTALLELPMPVSGRIIGGDRARAYLYLIPAASSLAIPTGLALGILCGLRGRIVHHRTRRAIVALTIVCSLVAFVTLAWIVPAGNQAFRVLQMGHDVARGPAEMTFHELGAQINELNGRGFLGDAIPLAKHYHLRWALSCAPLLLGLFALALSNFNRGHWRSILQGVAAVMTFDIYFMFVRHLPPFASDAWQTPFATAWMPNLVVAIAAAALHQTTRRTLG